MAELFTMVGEAAGAPAGAIALCDHCARDLKCTVGSAREREYWSTSSGFRICENCLAAANEFPSSSAEERGLALRLLHVKGINLRKIDEVLQAARGLIDPAQLDRLISARQQLFELHRDGELVAAMWAGQALWNSANHLRESMKSRKAVRAGQKTIGGGQKSGEVRRRQPGMKAAAIKAEAERYSGDKAAMVATVARRTGATPQYVRQVLRKMEI